MFLRKTAAAVVTAALIAVGGAATIVAPASAATTLTIGVPQDLRTQLVDDDVRFLWDGVDGASGYTIQLATDDQFATSNLVATRTTTARTWIPERTLGNLEDRGLYWRVAAHTSGTTDASRGAFSEPVTVDAPAAAAPALLSPAYGDVIDYPDPVTFRWTPVRGAISYTLTYSSSPDWATGTTTVPGLTGTSHTPVSPLERTSSGAPVLWSWKVQAVFANPSSTTTTADPVTGPASETATFTVRWTAADSAPTLLAPTSTDPIQSDLRFSWTPVAGATKYSIVIGQSVDDATGLVTTVKIEGDSTSTTYVPLEQLVDGNYWWQVTAYDPAGNKGQPSQAKQFRKAWGGQTAPTVSAAGFTKTYPYPTFGSTDIANPVRTPLDQVLLTWEPVPRATLYEVEAIPILRDSTDKRQGLTCRTASTSASIVGRVVEGTNDGSALEGDGTCLWKSTKANRMDPGGLYEWRVRAIDYSGNATTALQQATPAGSQESLWSDVDDGDTSRKRYFDVAPPRSGTDVTAVVDDESWQVERDTVVGKPAPLMKWSPVAGANAYEVAVYHDYDCSVHVTTQYTTQTHLRINGVFDDETSGEYCWRVRGVSANDAFSEFQPIVGSVFTPKQYYWQKRSTPVDFVGATPVTTTSDGSVVFSWRPQSESAPADGGSRGYAVTILDSSLTSKGTLKVEYPWYVAKTLDLGQKPLQPGSYWFKVAALDALGNPGNYTAPEPFTVAAPAPTDLTTRVDGTSATLSWSGTTAAAKYGVKVRPVGGTWPTTPTQVTQTSATVRDLDDGTYEWLVFSYDNSSYTSREATSGRFTVAAPVPVRTTADGAVLTPRDRVLDWTPVDGASRYLVQYSATAGTLDTATAAETLATSFAIPATLAYGTTYYWQVTAVPEKANTASTRVKLGKSSVGSFSVTNPPATVQIGLAVSGTDATVTWKTPAGADRGSLETPAYRLAYRASNANGTTSDWTLLTIEAGTESVKVGSLAPSTTYEFQLQAYNVEGASAWSTARSVTTAGAPTTPVTNLTAKPLATALTVSWRVPSGTGGSPITGYSVKYRKGEGSWVAVPAATSSTATTVEIKGLTTVSSYTVSVAPLNAFGAGPAATLTTATLGLATAPSNVKASRGNASATLSWSPPASNGGAAIQAYDLQYRAKSATTGWTTWRTGPSVSASARTATVTSLKNGSYYQIRVAARTQLGTGAWSTAAAVTPATKPSAPTSVKATSPATKTVKVTWRASVTNGSKISAYRVEYSTGSTWKTLATTSATATSYTWSKATKGTTYSFRVVATSNLGNSPASTVVRVVAR